LIPGLRRLEAILARQVRLVAALHTHTGVIMRTTHRLFLVVAIVSVGLFALGCDATTSESLSASTETAQVELSAEAPSAVVYYQIHVSPELVAAYADMVTPASKLNIDARVGDGAVRDQTAGGPAIAPFFAQVVVDATATTIGEQASPTEIQVQITELFVGDMELTGAEFAPTSGTLGDIVNGFNPMDICLLVPDCEFTVGVEISVEGTQEMIPTEVSLSASVEMHGDDLPTEGSLAIEEF
jgi:hypothetical protein